MYVTDKLVDFLNTSKNLSNSTIILTNLERVIFALSDLKNIYINKKISNELVRFFEFI